LQKKNRAAYVGSRYIAAFVLQHDNLSKNLNHFYYIAHTITNFFKHFASNLLTFASNLYTNLDFDKNYIYDVYSYIIYPKFIVFYCILFIVFIYYIYLKEYYGLRILCIKIHKNYNFLHFIFCEPV